MERDRERQYVTVSEGPDPETAVPVLVLEGDRRLIAGVLRLAAQRLGVPAADRSAPRPLRSAPALGGREGDA